MTPQTHPIEPEEVMAYLDGELSGDESLRVSQHLAKCPECRALAENFRAVSSRLLDWQIELTSVTLGDASVIAPPDAKSQWPYPSLIETMRRNRWAWDIAFGVAAALVLAVLASISFYGLRPAARALPQSAVTVNAVPDDQVHLRSGRETSQDGNGTIGRFATPSGSAGRVVSEGRAIRGGGGQAGDFEDKVPRGPMIARTASLIVSAKDFSATRAAVDRIVSAHQGYIANLKINSPGGATQSFEAQLRIPSDQLDAALSELKALGKVEQEQQGADEVSAQVIDLEARVKSAREEESRLQQILQTRTGKLSDVLEVEQEESRVRAEIERMQGEQKHLSNRIAYAAVSLTIAEEYHATLVGPSSAGRQLHNALVEGFRSAGEALLAVGVFLMNVGPSLVVWALILLWPARWAWTKWRPRETANDSAKS